MTSTIFSHFSAAVATSCPHGGFLGFPTWFEYLPGSIDPTTKICSPQLSSLSDVWLIGAAILEILLRVATIAAVGIIIYGGVMYVTSQGEPEKTGKAKAAITNALAGLVVSVMAGAIVAFIAGRIN
jgi:hypothetical protein